MKKFILFWNKDIINKLIVLVSIMLAAGVFAFIFMIFNMPEGKSLSEAVSAIIPLPSTSDPDSILTTTPEATNTALPFNVTQPPTEGAIIVQPTISPVLVIPTLAPEQFTPTPLASETPVVSLNADCIPGNTPQPGKAVSVIDGNTIKALIDGLVYVVRYIGISSPEDVSAGEQARLENARLVFGKEIVLISDQSDKDASGRLLRYVMVDDTFVNLELIRLGLGSALDVPPDSACAQTFKLAEQSAANIAIDNSTPTPIPTESPTP